MHPAGSTVQSPALRIGGPRHPGPFGSILSVTW